MEARRNLSGARVGTSGLRPRSRDVIMIILSSCALKLRLPFSAGRASSRAYPPQLRRDPRSLVKRRWIHFFDDVWRRSFAYFDPANLTSRIWPMSPTLVDHAQDACAFRINFSADFVAPLLPCFRLIRGIYSLFFLTKFSIVQIPSFSHSYRCILIIRSRI